MQEAFGYVLFAVVALGAVLAVASLLVKSSTYDQIGEGGFFEEEGPPARETSEEVDEEIRQLLRARNARSESRGREVVDVDDELARLKAPAVDPALRAEVRELVVARNRRRERQGKPPLDVEAEVARQLRELS